MEVSQLLKGVLDIAVLSVLNNHESYGYEILGRLAEAGLEGVGDASVYGTLRRLESSGRLRSRLESSSSGPARKYYFLTADGEALLAEAISSWTQVSKAMARLLSRNGAAPR